LLGGGVLQALAAPRAQNHAKGVEPDFFAHVVQEQAHGRAAQGRVGRRSFHSRFSLIEQSDWSYPAETRQPERRPFNRAEKNSNVIHQPGQDTPASTRVISRTEFLEEPMSRILILTAVLLTCVAAFSQESAQMSSGGEVQAGDVVTFTVTLDKGPAFDNPAIL